MLSQDKLVMARSADRDNLMWTRALARDPRKELPMAKESHEEHWYFADDVVDRTKVLTGDIYVDGSALFPTNTAARRAGWAAVNLKPDGTVRVAVCGHVPAGVSPSQTAAAGELHALRRAAELACGPVRILTDYQSAVDGNRRGAAATTGYRTASAASRRGYWRATDGERMDVLKVEAHRSARSAREDEDDAEAMTKKLGNDAADMFAKRGAATHHTASELAVLEDYVTGEAELRELALFIGTALANWPPAPRNTRVNDGTRTRRREAARRRRQAAARHGHRIQWSRNGWQCTACGKASSTLAGRRRLELTACAGHTGARIEEQGADPSAHVLWAAEADTTDAGAGGADVVWCSRCGGYSSTKLYKLKGSCPGTADPPARTRLAQLNRRRHPTLGYGLGCPVRLTDDVIAQLRAAGGRQQADFARVLKGATGEQMSDLRQTQARHRQETPAGSLGEGHAAGRGEAEMVDEAMELDTAMGHPEPEDEDVFGFGGGFDEEDDVTIGAAHAATQHCGDDVAGGMGGPETHGREGTPPQAQQMDEHTADEAAQARGRSDAARRRITGTR